MTPTGFELTFTVGGKSRVPTIAPIARTDTEVSASDLASVSPLDSREILEQYKSHRGWEQGTPPRASAGSRISREVWLPWSR